MTTLRLRVGEFLELDYDFYRVHRAFEVEGPDASIVPKLVADGTISFSFTYSGRRT